MNEKEKDLKQKAEERVTEKIVSANIFICDILEIKEFTNFIEEESGINNLLNCFYFLNKPDVHCLYISSQANITTINIQNVVSKSTIVHTVHDDFCTCLLLAVYEFAKYIGQEYRPI